jgi:hypothetical protein
MAGVPVRDAASLERVRFVFPGKRDRAEAENAFSDIV